MSIKTLILLSPTNQEQRQKPLNFKGWHRSEQEKNQLDLNLQKQSAQPGLIKRDSIGIKRPLQIKAKPLKIMQTTLELIGFETGALVLL